MKLLAAFACILLAARISSAQDLDSRGLKGELTAEFADSFDRLIDLAREIPADLYSWRPADDMRSVSEIFVRAAVASYRLCSVVGKPEHSLEDVRELESSLTVKEDVIKLLQDARDHAIDTLVELDAAVLESKVKWHEGSEMTLRGALLSLSGDMSEHLGEVVAYARINAVVPPWDD